MSFHLYVTNLLRPDEWEHLDKPRCSPPPPRLFGLYCGLICILCISPMTPGPTMSSCKVLVLPKITGDSSSMSIIPILVSSKCMVSLSHLLTSWRQAPLSEFALAPAGSPLRHPSSNVVSSLRSSLGQMNGSIWTSRFARPPPPVC